MKLTGYAREISALGSAPVLPDARPMDDIVECLASPRGHPGPTQHWRTRAASASACPPPWSSALTAWESGRRPIAAVPPPATRPGATPCAAGSPSPSRWQGSWPRRSSRRRARPPPTAGVRPVTGSPSLGAAACSRGLGSGLMPGWKPGVRRRPLTSRPARRRPSTPTSPPTAPMAMAQALAASAGARARGPCPTARALASRRSPRSKSPPPAPRSGRRPAPRRLRLRAPGGGAARRVPGASCPGTGCPGGGAGRRHQGGPLPLLTPPNGGCAPPRHRGRHASARCAAVPSAPRRRGRRQPGPSRKRGAASHAVWPSRACAGAGPTPWRASRRAASVGCPTRSGTTASGSPGSLQGAAPAPAPASGVLPPGRACRVTRRHASGTASPRPLSPRGRGSPPTAMPRPPPPAWRA
jgi:hypothetical protein